MMRKKECYKKKRKFIIIGAGSYAVMLKNYINMTHYGRVLGYAVEKDYISEDYIEGIKVLSIEEMFELHPKEKVELIMGIGYKDMGNLRKKLFLKCKENNYKFANYIHPTAIISQDLKIGEGNNILEGVIIQEGVIIGHANLLYAGSLIAHETSIGNFNSISVRTTVAGCVTIQDNCFLGAASTVRDHVTINEYALVGADTYVNKDMPSYKVLKGTCNDYVENKISLDYL